MSVHKDQGFTLFELMIAFAIAAILVGLAVPSFRSMRINSSISSLAGEAVLSVNEARSRAITSRSRFYVVQGPGLTATDTGTVGAGDWVGGWRILAGPTIATATLVSRNDKKGNASGGSGVTQVSLFVTDKAVDAAGNVDGNKINGFGFNNFGQLIALDGSGLASAVIVICAPNSTAERGRAISISSLGRVTNNVVTDPASCS